MANVLSRLKLADTAVHSLAVLANNSHMIDLTEKYEHYRRRFREAMAARSITNEEMATRLDAHAVTVSKLRSGKIALDDEWRERVSIALRMDHETLFGNAPLLPPAPDEIFRPKKKRGRKPANDNSTLTVYGFAAGSQFGHRNNGNQLLEQIPRPPGLSGVETAYALRTRNDSMAPRYLPEDILYINPEENLKPGDHIVIQARNHDGEELETWVKRLDSITNDEVIVYQYNPPARIIFKRKYVKFMHRILPTNELFP